MKFYHEKGICGILYKLSEIGKIVFSEIFFFFNFWHEILQFIDVGVTQTHLIKIKFRNLLLIQQTADV